MEKWLERRLGADVKNERVRSAYGKAASFVGIGSNVVLFIGKLIVGTVSGSVAITADAANNLSDASSSVVSLLGFKLADKPAVFKVKLHEVKARELPELDDEFAKDVSEFDTLEELRASIRKGLEDVETQQADLDVENALVDQVIAGMQAEIPQAMVDTAIDEIIRDFGYRLSQQGLKLDDYLKYMGEDMAAFRGSFAERAEKQVKIRLALEAVAVKENIVVSDEEFEAEVKRIAEQYKMEVEQVKSVVDAEAVKHDLAINKAIDFIKSKAEITTETVTEEPAAE